MKRQMRPDSIDYAIGMFGVVATIAATLGVAWLDPEVAARRADSIEIDVLLGKIVGFLDIATGKGISNFLLGFAIILAALAVLGVGKLKSQGWTLLYIGLVQFSTTVIADLSKPQFGRLRPFEVADSGSAVDQWFVAGNSFPSGHVAFYAGLAMPLIVLSPRWWPLFLSVPLLVAFERVASNDHYLGDVAASFALSALLALSWRFILSHRPLPRDS